MNRTQKLIRSGLAACALATLAIPTVSWAVSPAGEVYNAASMGNRANMAPIAVEQAQVRPGYRWVPGITDSNGVMQTPGVWMRDETHSDWKKFEMGDTTVYANGPLDLKDSEGKSIPIDPAAYPIDSPRR